MEGDILPKESTPPDKDETDKAKPTEEFAVNNLGLSSGDTTQQSDIIVGSPATSPNNDSNSFSLSSGGFLPNSVQSTVTSPVTDELSIPVTDTDNISDPQDKTGLGVELASKKVPENTSQTSTTTQSATKSKTLDLAQFSAPSQSTADTSPKSPSMTINRRNKPPSIQPPIRSSPLTPPYERGSPDGEGHSSVFGTRPRSRHSSGNPPGVRGLIIESRTSRESSPIRGTSPFASPRVSPAYHMSDRTFVLPTSGGARPRIPSSTSDNTIFSGGARPKSAPRDIGGGQTPARPHNSGGDSPDERQGVRRYSESNLAHRRGSRVRLSMSGQAAQDDVIEQSEEVFKNYMFERYSQDQLREDGNVNTPRSPTVLENFTSTPQTATSAVGRRLACIGDEIEAKYGQEFTKFGKALNIRQGALDQAYDAFRGVAMKLFNDGLSMGRIVALLQFGYHIAINTLQQGIGDFMSDIIGWLVRFITYERIRNVVNNTFQSIAEWIASLGGWQAAVDSDSTFSSQLRDAAPNLALFGAATAALVALTWWLRHR